MFLVVFSNWMCILCCCLGNRRWWLHWRSNTLISVSWRTVWCTVCVDWRWLLASFSCAGSAGRWRRGWCCPSASSSPTFPASGVSFSLLTHKVSVSLSLSLSRCLTRSLSLFLSQQIRYNFGVYHSQWRSGLYLSIFMKQVWHLYLSGGV